MFDRVGERLDKGEVDGVAGGGGARRNRPGIADFRTSVSVIALIPR